jgi:hypothetical protein
MGPNPNPFQAAIVPIPMQQPRFHNRVAGLKDGRSSAANREKCRYRFKIGSPAISVRVWSLEMAQNMK